MVNSSYPGTHKPICFCSTLVWSCQHRFYSTVSGLRTEGEGERVREGEGGREGWREEVCVCNGPGLNLFMVILLSKLFHLPDVSIHQP